MALDHSELILILNTLDISTQIPCCHYGAVDYIPGKKVYSGRAIDNIS